jgi:hypothetical protein
MIEPVQYPYSLKFSLGTLAVIIILMLIVFRNIGGNNITFVYIIYGFISLVFISLTTVLVLKRLIPALKGNIALQLDEEGISDYVKEVSINWKDIKEIHLVRGRSASIMRVDLKWESDYGNQIAIYLRWVKGDDKEIFEKTQAWFEQQSAAVSD